MVLPSTSSTSPYNQHAQRLSNSTTKNSSELLLRTKYYIFYLQIFSQVLKISVPHFPRLQFAGGSACWQFMPASQHRSQHSQGISGSIPNALSPRQSIVRNRRRWFSLRKHSSDAELPVMKLPATSNSTRLVIESIPDGIFPVRLFSLNWKNWRFSSLEMLAGRVPVNCAPPAVKRESWVSSVMESGICPPTAVVLRRMSVK